MVAVSVAGSVIQPLRGELAPQTPLVGRTQAEIDAGVGPGVVEITPHGGLPLARLEATETLLASIPWPAFASGLVIHLFPGRLPGADLEEGAPWHLILRAGGRTEIGVRYRAGRPSLPPTLHREDAVNCLHIAVPWAGRREASRLEGLLTLVAALRERAPHPLVVQILAADPSMAPVAAELGKRIPRAKELKR